MSVQIDNVKMWESITDILDANALANNDIESRFICFLKATIVKGLNDQGLEYKDGRIISKTEPLTELEIDKYYVCIKDCYTAVGAKFLTKDKLYRCIKENEVADNIGRRVWVGDCLADFRPATEEEIKGNNWRFSPKLEQDQDAPDELTDFETALYDLVQQCQVEERLHNYDILKKFIKQYSWVYLSKARKQIASEIDVNAMVKNLCFNTGVFSKDEMRQSYRQGIEDVLKKIKGE